MDLVVWGTEIPPGSNAYSLPSSWKALLSSWNSQHLLSVLLPLRHLLQPTL